MIPLAPDAIPHVRAWLGRPREPALLALYHALEYGRPGLWGDDPSTPESVVLVREGDDQIEAFGAGNPEPAAGWLAGQGRAGTLLAPASWHDAVAARVGPVEPARVETRSLVAFDPARASLPTRPAVPLVPLTLEDAAGFVGSAPAWALRGWGSYPELIAHGAGFGVRGEGGFVALAWTFDGAGHFDAVGVHTAPRFRRLGLGRAVASALIAHIVRRRGRIPLWSTTPGNAASRALARSLGFSSGTSELLLRWPPRRVP